MANGHGGARPGAGRKKKPLSDKLLEGNPGKRAPQVLGFVEGLPEELAPPDYLDGFVAMDVEPAIDQIYRDTVNWLQRTGCLHLINPQHITDYVMLKSRWLECEALVQAQLLTFVQHCKWVDRPFVDISLKYLKQADVTWGKIWSVVAQNCAYNFGGENPNADVMSTLLDMDLED
jgi:hypothetical protein